MKIINKLLLTLIFVSNTGLAYSDSDHIAVDTQVHTNIPEQRPNLLLKPTNPAYLTIERELSTLKRYVDQSGVAKLDADKSPELNKLISSILSRLCKEVGIDVPPVQIYFRDANDTYNAQANICPILITETVEISKNKRIIKREPIKTYKIKKNRLQLGEGLIKLLLWNTDGNAALESIIAHEVGHMKQDETMNKIQAEYDADARAIQLVGSNKGELLIQSINKATLSGHIFNILAGQADIFRLSVDDVHQLNRIITNSIAQNYHTLGDLGQSSSHTKFGLVINKVFTDALKYSFDPKVGLTEENFYTIYEKLEKACKNMSEFMGSEQDIEVSLRCAYIEEYSNRFFSPITHPSPKQRFNHIYNCINAKEA